MIYGTVRSHICRQVSTEAQTVVDEWTPFGGSFLLLIHFALTYTFVYKYSAHRSEKVTRKAPNLYLQLCGDGESLSFFFSSQRTVYRLVDGFKTQKGVVKYRSTCSKNLPSSKLTQCTTFDVSRDSVPQQWSVRSLLFFLISYLITFWGYFEILVRILGSLPPGLERFGGVCPISILLFLQSDILRGATLLMETLLVTLHDFLRF